LVHKKGFLKELVSKHRGVVEKRCVCHTRCPRFAPPVIPMLPIMKNRSEKRKRKENENKAEKTRFYFFALEMQKCFKMT
jgi:hypothetical protein